MALLDTLRGLGRNVMWGAGKGIQGLGELAPLATATAGGFYGGPQGAGIGFQAGMPLRGLLSNLGGYLAGDQPQGAPLQQAPAVAGQMMPQGQQPVSAMQMSPERQAYNQLLGDWSNFNAQPYIQEAIGRYQEDIVPQIAERFAGAGQRGSAFRNALARGGQGFARGLQSDIWQQQQQQRTMLANLLAGQQAAQQQNLALALQGYGQQGQLGLQAAQLGLQRAASPVQAGLQASGIGLGQMQTPYMQQGQPGWLPQVLSGLGQAAGLGTQMYRTAKGL